MPSISLSEQDNKYSYKVLLFIAIFCIIYFIIYDYSIGIFDHFRNFSIEIILYFSFQNIFPIGSILILSIGMKENLKCRFLPQLFTFVIFISLVTFLSKPLNYSNRDSNFAFLTLFSYTSILGLSFVLLFQMLKTRKIDNIN